MKKDVDKSNELCKHVLRTTLGLPCACEMYQALISGTEIRMTDIHAFWSTLTVLDEDEPKHNVGPGVRSDEHRYMDSLVDELEGMDPEVVGQTTRKMHETMYPNEATYFQPKVKDTSRGRPRGSTSTQRVKSWWEKIGICRKSSKKATPNNHTQSPVNPTSTQFDRPSSSAQPTRHSTSGQPARHSTSSQPPPIIQDNELLIEITSTYIYDFFGFNEIRPLFYPYTVAYLNVVGDGNCGFWVAVDSVWGSQHLWPQARQTMANEVWSNMAEYHLHWILETVQRMMERIN